jgi:hypothetical protein
MSHDANDLPPLVREVAPENPALHADWTHAAEARLEPPTTEQVRAADGVFTPHPEQPAEALFGLWSSTLILHGLAVETFQASTDEEEEGEPEKE